MNNREDGGREGEEGERNILHIPLINFTHSNSGLLVSVPFGGRAINAASATAWHA